MKLRGLDEVLKNLRAAGERGRRAVGAGLYVLGNEIMTDSKHRVPVDLGTLKGSGYVTLPMTTTGKDVRVELGYGGPAKAYAVVQHERTELHHEDGGEAKYLENAVNAASGTALQRVREVARTAFEADREAPGGVNPTTPEQG